MPKLIGVLLLAIAVSPEEAIRREREKFEGNWKVASIEVDGVQLPAEQVREFTLTFKGGKFISRMGDKMQNGTYTIDPTKTPKTMDITNSDGPDKGKLRPVIYTLEDNTLRICGSEVGKDRPTEFKTKDHKGIMLMILRRE